MECRIQDLRHKQVVCLADGTMIGSVSDLTVDTASAMVVSLVVYGKPRLFGLLGREDDYIIPWSQIEVIGEDTILISGQYTFSRKRKRNMFAKFAIKS